MAKPRPSVLKRQREQAKRDKQAAKIERREQRKLDRASNNDDPDNKYPQREQ